MLVAVLHAGVALLVSLMRVLPASTVDVGTLYQPVSPISIPIYSTALVVKRPAMITTFIGRHIVPESNALNNIVVIIVR